MNKIYPLQQSFLSKEDQTALAKLVKTPLLILMIPILFVIMVFGLLAGAVSAVLSPKKPKAVAYKRKTE